MIYFDNAATSGKKPEIVVQSVNYAMKQLSANAGRSGHKLSVKCAEEIFNVRKKISEFFGADGAEQVIFTKNCTESINVVLKGLLNANDQVLISDFEHNAVMRPLTAIGCKYRQFCVSLNDDNITLENLKKLIDDNTKMIFVTSASNVLGKTLPLEEIGKIAKEKNILFGVDAAQGGGVIPIDMNRQNIDFLCLAPHKGLLSAMGTGVLIARKEINKTIIEGGTGTDSLNFLQPKEIPERFESGTLNLPGIISIGAGLDYIKKLDSKIYKNEMHLTKKLYDELKNIDGINLYAPKPEIFLYTPVISFNIDDISSQKTAEILNGYNVAVRGGLHCAPTAHKKMHTTENGAVRISLGAFNNQNEVEKFLYIIKKITKNRKKYVE